MLSLGLWVLSALFVFSLTLRSGPGLGLKLRDLWTLEGELDRGPYVAWGFLLFALKHNLDRVLAWRLFGIPWSVFDYLLKASDTSFSARYTDLPPDRFRFYLCLVLLALPFIWTGVALSVRRLRSIGLPPALSAVFFVPFANLLFFLVLAVVPAGDNKPGAEASGLGRFIPDSKWGSAALAVGASVLLLLAGTLFSVQLLGQYGWGLFVGLPFCLGLISTLIHGYREPRTFASCISVATAAVVVAGGVLFAVAVEGVICLAMAFPIGVALAWMGATVGYFLQKHACRQGTAMAALLLALPGLMGAEYLSPAASPVRPLRTVIVIDAPPAVVWKNVVSFSELPPPKHWLFKLGFAYPLRATIAGRGPGAVRRCTFSTGSFVEPITVWDEPRLLRFSVTAQPPPMKEWTFYKSINAPHLDHFLVSEQGQFELTALPGGRTRLEGTTWYRHAISPAVYWQPWSDFIIHRIHERVLDHIKTLSEQKA